MSWQDSLVRIAGYDVEQLRVRLAAVLERKVVAEMRLALLHAEAEAEARKASIDAEAGWYRLGYLEGWRARRDAAEALIAELALEETGARDALAEAFAALKKYEQVQEGALAAARKTAARLERADLDELGARKAAAR